MLFIITFNRINFRLKCILSLALTCAGFECEFRSAFVRTFSLHRTHTHIDFAKHKREKNELSSFRNNFPSQLYEMNMNIISIQTFLFDLRSSSPFSLPFFFLFVYLLLALSLLDFVHLGARTQSIYQFVLCVCDDAVAAALQLFSSARSSFLCDSVCLCIRRGKEKELYFHCAGAEKRRK